MLPWLQMQFLSKCEEVHIIICIGTFILNIFVGTEKVFPTLHFRNICKMLPLKKCCLDLDLVSM